MLSFQSVFLFRNSFGVIFESLLYLVLLSFKLGGALAVRLRGCRVNEDLIEIDHHYAAVFCNAAQQIVRDVARLIVEGARRGVRGYDGDFGSIKRVAHRLVRYVSNVNQHPQTIHLANYLTPEIRQAVMYMLAAPCVSPIVRVVPRQGHVTHAKAVELA